MKTRFAIIMLAALLAPAAEAAPVPPNTVVKAPDWSAGSEWHYSDGYAVKINAVSAKGATFERLDAPGQSFTRQGFIRTDSVSGTATRNAIYRTVPDTAGLSLSAAKPLTFQREYLNNGKLLVHASSWSVEGRETVTVPAGSFDCWVIVWRTRSMKSDWTGFERWWYSPQAQNYVRMEYKYGPDEDGSRVLMTYNLAGAQSVSAAPLVPEPVLAPVPPPAPVVTPRPAVVTVVPASLKQEPRKEEIAKPVTQIRVAAPAVRSSVKPESIAAAAPVLADEPLPMLAERKVQPVRAEMFALAKVEITPAVEMPESPGAEPVKIAEAKPAKPDAPSLPKGDRSGPWHAQLGASLDAANVRTSLKKILARNPGAHVLPNGVTVREVEGRTFYRAWLGSYGSAPEARSLCDALNIKKARISGCTVFKGPTTMEARAN